MKKITVILPVYNESEGIEQFNKELQGVLESLRDKYHFEVLFVLDKSSDNSNEKIKAICDSFNNCRLIALSRRFGHQTSLIVGMHQATGDAAIMMDSDLEHPPKFIPELLKKFEEGFDVVQTKRVYHSKVSLWKKTTSKLFYRLLSYLSDVEISESAADFRLISRKVLKIFQEDMREQNLFLRGLFPWVGLRQTSIQFVSESRKFGRSKYNISRLLNFATLGIISFSKKPLRFAITLGMFISVLSFLYGIISVLYYFINSGSPPGWTSVIASVSFLGGVQLIFLGIIGEYIGGIFDEVKRRPRYIIEEEYGVTNDELYAK